MRSQDRIGMRADDHARLSNAAQQFIEPVAGGTFTGIAQRDLLARRYGDVDCFHDVCTSVPPGECTPKPVPGMALHGDGDPGAWVRRGTDDDLYPLIERDQGLHQALERDMFGNAPTPAHCRCSLRFQHKAFCETCTSYRIRGGADTSLALVRHPLYRRLAA